MFKYLIFLSLIISICSFGLKINQLEIPYRLEKKVLKVFKKLLPASYNTLSFEVVDTYNATATDYRYFFDDNSLYTFVNPEDNSEGVLCIRRAYGCQVGGCETKEGELFCKRPEGSDLSYEKFDYMILFDSLGVVDYVQVLDYPGDHGYEISNKKWLKKFKGYAGGKLRYGKEIDAISGATISANSITQDIKQVHHAVQVVLNRFPLDDKIVTNR